MYSTWSASGVTGSSRTPPTGVSKHAAQITETTAAGIPRKRSSDEVVFVSSRPAKKKRATDMTGRPTPTRGDTVSYPASARSRLHLPKIHHAETQAEARPRPLAGDISAVALTASGDDVDEIVQRKHLPHDRRVSTGMVTIQSEKQTNEGTAGFRGVSLPEVLDSFSFDQPYRRSRQASSPTISPKSLPRSMTSSIRDGNSTPETAPERTTIQSVAPFDAGKVHGEQIIPYSPANFPICTLLPNSFDPPRPIPTETTGAMASASSHGGSTKPACTEHATTQYGNLPTASVTGSAHSRPFGICLHEYPPATLATGETLPPTMPHDIANAASYFINPSAQIITTPSPEVYQPGHSSRSVRLPVDMSNFGDQMSHQPSAGVQPVEYQASSRAAPKPISTPETAFRRIGSLFHNEIPAHSSPAQSGTLPAQTAHRNLSPNLIVDIAETCLARFPFEEMARRHGTSADIVYEIFAAIIQVPLLRCPTDRRLPGNLAMVRLKEYANARSNIHKARGESQAGQRLTGVTSVDIARTLGPLELPKDSLRKSRRHM